MGVLDGVRILDLGHHVAGPLAARLLGMHGADVIRVDRPGGEDREADAFLHAGKRRITLDLKDPGDRETARGLAARSDVLIENFRPGVMDRLGLSPALLRAASPGLVYLSLPGFAAADPRAQLPGWEGVIAAATGNCRVRVGEGPAEWDPDRPTFSALPLASNFAAILGATASVTALIRRERTATGAHIEVPLHDAVFELMGGAGAYSLARGYRLEDPLVANGSGTYRCADGAYVQFNPIGATMRFLTWFLDAAGEEDWVAEGFTRFSTYRAEPAAAAELRERLTALFLTRPAQEWEYLGMSAGVPLCRVRTTAEWAETEHARASGQVARVVDPVLGDTWIANAPVHFSAAEPAPPAPRRARDADRDDVLALLDEPVRPTAPATAAPAPALDGLRVVDLTQILAGPSAGRILAEFGADVVKVNSPQRVIEAHGIVNRGKRSVLIDLQRSEGQDLLWKLIDQADVVTQNFPQGTAERYGIGFRHVHARKPGIVYVSVSCYGYRGPWARGRGYEVQGQAVVGIMERTGRGFRPGVLGPYNPLDYGTGTMAALAATLGLYHATRTGEGVHVSTSLAQTGTFHQATQLVVHAAKTWGEPAGPDALGAGPLQRFYRASDDWFFLGASDAQTALVREVVGTSDEGGLETAFAAEPAETWVARLRAAGIGAHEIVRLPGLLDEPYVVSTGLSVRQVSEEAGDVVMPGPAILLDGERLPAGRAVRRPGGDGAEVLGELHADLEPLESGWVVQTRDLPAGWPVS